MKFASVIISILITFVVSACALTPSQSMTSQSESTSAVFQALNEGGYVIAIRHGMTNADEADTMPLNLDDCAPQRHLNDRGRQTATALGKQFARSNVVIDAIFSSRYCRAIETAERFAEPLNFRSIIKTDDVSEGGQVVSPNENKRRTAVLRKLVSTVPSSGKNTVIVSHKPNMIDAFGVAIFDITEGEMLVFKPSGNDFKLMWRVKPSDIALYQESLNK